MAILWLFDSHKGCLMAPRLLQHEYLLAPMVWCGFYHFRISGSIICRQLLHSFTDVMKGASPFVLKMLEKYFLDISTVILNHKVFEIALERSLCIGIIIQAHD